MDIDVIKVRDADSAEERIVLYVNQDCNLSWFIVVVSLSMERNLQFNKERFFMILPSLDVKKGDYIWLYSKKGEYESFPNKSSSTTHVLYWNLDHSFLNGQKSIYLFHFDQWTSKNIEIIEGL